MPAKNMNSLTNVAPIVADMQHALFKLWVIMTTNQLTVSPASEFFATTAEADKYVTEKQNSEETYYYVDLEALSPQLLPLSTTQILNIVNTLSVEHRDFIQRSADLFWTLAQGPGGYPDTGQCGQFEDVLGTYPAATETAVPENNV